MFPDLVRLARHGGVYLLGNIINRAGAFLLLPLYTKYLTVPQFGALELLYSFNAVLSVLLSAGLSHATLRFYFEYDDARARAKVITTNFLVVLMLGVVGAAGVIIWSSELATALFSDAVYTGAIQLCAGIILLSLSTEILLAYLRAEERSWLFVAASTIRLLLQVGLSLYFVAGLDKGVEGVLSANLASVAAVWVVLLAYTVRKCGIKIDIAMLMPILRYSTPFFLSTIIGAVGVNADRFLLQHYMSLQEVGIYGLAAKFGLLMTVLIAEPFYRAYGPFRFSIIRQDNAEEIQILVMKYVVAVAIFMGLGISLFAPELILLLARKEYAAAAGAVPFVVLAGILPIVSYCQQTGILYQKKTHLILNISIVSAVLSVGLNVLLIPIFGVMGAASALLMVKTVEMLITAKLGQRLYPVAYDWQALLVAVILGVAVFSMALLMVETGLVALLAKGALLATFAAALILLDGKARTMVWRFFRGRRSVVSAPAERN